MAPLKPKHKAKPFYHVAVGAVVSADNKVLIAKRADHKLQGGRWEFPGGKLEAGETALAGLARELEEELGIVPQKTRPLIQIPYDYSEFEVLLDVHRVENFTGTPHARENQDFQWVDISRLDDFEFPDANVPIVRAIQLPSVYKIVDAVPKQFDAKLIRVRKGDMSVDAYQSIVGAVLYAAQALREAQSQNVIIDLMAMNDLSEYSGLHLTAIELHQFEQRPVPKNKLLGASLHTLEDVQQANKLQCDFATLSPVKHTSSHPDASPIGWERFAELIHTAHFPVYALGGMSQEDLETAWAHGAQGVAGIRHI